MQYNSAETDQVRLEKREVCRCSFRAQVMALGQVGFE